VIVSGYVTFFQINKFSVNIFIFIIDKVSLRPNENGFARRIWPAGPILVYPARTISWDTKSVLSYVQLVENEAHLLRSASNVFWINDIKRFQPVFIALFDQQKTATFLAYKT